MMTYILIGIVFMFFVEWSTGTDTFKRHIISKGNLPMIMGWKERFIGVFFWPICLGIFKYHFLKQIFK